MSSAPIRQPIRLGADIGGTFTDIALECRGTLFSTKVLTNYAAPEQAILDGIAVVLEQAGIGLGDLDIIIHGTTLATNALIERRGARTAFVTTEGFRDVIEMRTESRFEQYDLNLRLPTPLIPREDRFAVRGRIGDALGANPAGVLLAGVAAGLIPWLLACAATGRLRAGARSVDGPILVAAVVVATVGVLSWFARYFFGRA